MSELKKTEQFKSDNHTVFSAIKDRLIDNSKPTGQENQYIIDNAGVTMTYTITKYIQDELLYIDFDSRTLDGYLNFEFEDIEDGSLMKIDMNLHNKSIFGGIMGFIMNIDKIENKLIYELKKGLGEI